MDTVGVRIHVHKIGSYVAVLNYLPSPVLDADTMVAAAGFITELQRIPFPGVVTEHTFHSHCLVTLITSCPVELP